MTYINNNIAFKELKRGKITFTIWKKYLRNILIGLLLLQAIASVGQFYAFLYQSENTISTQNIYVTKEGNKRSSLKLYYPYKARYL